MCDVDGTLLDPAGRLTPAVAEAVARLIQGGVHVVLASGRIPAGLRRLWERLGLTGPQIAMHGALVVTPDGRALLERRLEPEDVVAHLDFARTMDVPPVLCFPDRLVTDRITPAVEQAFRPYDEPMPEVRSDLEALAGSGPFKTCLPFEGPRYHLLLEEARTRFEDRYTATSANERELELLRPEATKGSAARFVAEVLGVPPGRVAAVGDGPNDIELFRAAGASAALANAGPAVRAAASFVAPGNDEDGAAVAIARMFPTLFRERPG